MQNNESAIATTEKLNAPSNLNEDTKESQVVVYSPQSMHLREAMCRSLNYIDSSTDVLLTQMKGLFGTQPEMEVRRVDTHKVDTAIGAAVAIARLIDVKCKVAETIRNINDEDGMPLEILEGRAYALVDGKVESFETEEDVENLEE